MKVSPEITTQIISYISEFAAEKKFITNHVQSSKVLQKSELHKLFKCHSLSGSNKTSNERKWHIDKAHTKSVTQWEGGQHQLKGHPTQ